MNTQTTVAGDETVSATCPLCGGTEFGDYRKRKAVRCTQCGSFERGRFLGLVLQRLAPEPMGAPVVHFAPEPGTSAFLHRTYGERYVPADVDPAAYPWMELPMRQIDLCRPSDYLEPKSVQGLVHSHILEHIPADLTTSLLQMNAAIMPGGFHIFVVPFFSPYYREDMSPEMSHEQRDELFGQFDHVRSFGTEDFLDRIELAFRDFERVDLSQHITADDLHAASVPIRALTSLTAHTVFFFRKRPR